jgi:hypothetical protein
VHVDALGAASKHDRGPKEAAVESKVRITDPNLKVCAAFDLMRIKVGDICKMEAYNAVLSQYFDDRRNKEKIEDEEGEERQDAKKQKQKVSKKKKS